MRVMLLSVVLVLLGATGGAGRPARWVPVARAPGVTDLSAFRDGAILVGTTGGLALMRPGRSPVAYAPAYRSPGGDEPYMAVSPVAQRGRCSFGAPAGAAPSVYLLRLVRPTGVTRVDASGGVRAFARIAVPNPGFEPPAGFENGIAFDTVGHFGYRLLVTAEIGIDGRLYAIDCRGRVRMLAHGMPKVEGGIAIAPTGFGQYGGLLIAPDEVSGHVYAIPPNGQSEVISTLEQGSDAGVESVAFVPPGFGPGWSALVADRDTPDNPHPGDDAILALDGGQLRAEGVQPGDLLAVSEGGARTDAIRCGRTCRHWHVADGPADAHAEGHVIFVHASVAALTLPAPGNSAPPVVAGSASIGQTLTCSPGTWTHGPLRYAYQWFRDGRPVAGATASAYIVTAADAGLPLSCEVVASNSGGTATAISASVQIP
jgi:hypothetical protein